MKITLNKEALQPFLPHNYEVAATQMDFTKLVLLEAASGELVMTTTDGAIWMKSRVQAVEVNEPGRVCLNVQDLHAIIQKLEYEQVFTLTVNSRENEAANLDVVIKTENAEYTLSGTGADDYPESKDLKVPICEINVANLVSLLEHTVHAMAVKDVRHYLNGLKLEVSASGENVAGVAMDGHRLAFAEVLNKAGVAEESEHIMLLPHKAVKILQDVLGDADGDAKLKIFREDDKVMGGDYQISIVFGNISIVTRLVEAQYPEYRHMFPQQDAENWFEIDSEVFRQALDRVTVLRNIDSNHPHIQIVAKEGGKLQLMCTRSSSNESAKTEIEVKASSAGELKMRFNASYVRDILNTMVGGKDTVIKFSYYGHDTASKVEQIVSKGEGKSAPKSLCLIMPLRN